MLWLIALAGAANSAPAPSSKPAPVVAQASASVRIISGVRLSFDSPTNDGAPRMREGTVTVSGRQQPARLIEFE